METLNNERNSVVRDREAMVAKYNALFDHFKELKSKLTMKSANESAVQGAIRDDANASLLESPISVDAKYQLRIQSLESDIDRLKRKFTESQSQLQRFVEICESQEKTIDELRDRCDVLQKSAAMFLEESSPAKVFHSITMQPINLQEGKRRHPLKRLSTQCPEGDDRHAPRPRQQSNDSAQARVSSVL
jgi:predicted  nucleic acid-binding Zn-ribbon protein